MIFGTPNDIWQLLLLKEAYELDLIDKEWYKNYIKYTLKNIYFEHFKEEPESEHDDLEALQNDTRTEETKED